MSIAPLNIESARFAEQAPVIWTISTPVPPASKALKAVDRAKARVYGSFLRRAGAQSLDELVLSADDGEAQASGSPWVWAVNFCELGAPLEMRRAELLSRFADQDRPLWVPIIGAVSVRFGSVFIPSAAHGISHCLER